MISITMHCTNLALKKGVQFHFNTPVQKSFSTKEGFGRGGGPNENIMAELVVSNMDVYFTYLNLLNNTQGKKNIKTGTGTQQCAGFFIGE